MSAQISYALFGDEWKAEVLRMTKADIVDMAAESMLNYAKDSDAARADLARLRDEFLQMTHNLVGKEDELNELRELVEAYLAAKKKWVDHHAADFTILEGQLLVDITAYEAAEAALRAAVAEGPEAGA